jgi:hypothetical protein
MVVLLRLIGAPDHVVELPLETGVTGVGMGNGVAGQKRAVWIVAYEVWWRSEHVVCSCRLATAAQEGQTVFIE